MSPRTVEDTRRRSARIRITVWVLSAVAVMLYVATFVVMSLRNGAF
jgi:hypothetical protein